MRLASLPTVFQLQSRDRRRRADGKASGAVRIEALTFFRFVAAAIVVIFHFGRAIVPDGFGRPFLLAGPQMVSFFFTLSGFVLMAAYYPRKSEPIGRYFATRVARIVPVYLVSLLAMALSVEWQGTNNLTGLFLAATFLHGWFPPYWQAFNPPSWSLSAEAFFYLTFPLLIWIVTASNMSAKAFLILAGACYVLTQAILINLLNSSFYAGYPSISHDLIYYLPLSHYCSFLLGAAGGYLYCMHPEAFGRADKTTLVLVIGALIGTFAAIEYELPIALRAGIQLPFASSFHALVFLLLILAVARGDNGITRTLSLRPLVVLGEASYALYILQHPIRVFHDRMVAPKLALSPMNDFLVYAAMLLAAAIVSFYWIEKPAKALIIRGYEQLSGHSSSKAAG